MTTVRGGQIQTDTEVVENSITFWIFIPETTVEHLLLTFIQSVQRWVKMV